jgi:hypothetical protein
MFGADAYCSWADDIIVSETASLSRFRVTHASPPLTPPHGGELRQAAGAAAAVAADKLVAKLDRKLHVRYFCIGSRKLRRLHFGRVARLLFE